MPAHISPVAVIGTGTMGSAVVRRLVGADHPVRAYDIAEEALAVLPRTVVLATSSADAAAGADVVLLSLPAPADVLDVVAELAASPRTRSKLVVDLSTIDPATARAASERLGAAGISYLDGPILGRPATAGQWTIVLGGDSRLADAVTPLLLTCLARQVVRVGEVGAGSVVKLMNNLMFGAINAITAEVLTVCAAAGLDPGTFVDVVRDSGAASVSGLFRDIAPRIVAGDFEPTFMVSLLHKDNKLALKLADEVDVPSLVGRSAHELNTMAMRRYAKEDSAAVIKVLEEMTGLTARRGRQDS